MPYIAVEPLPEIIVTASRAEDERKDTAASVTLIDADRIERLGEPLATSLLRQAPSVAISTSGAAGSITEVRIRGAEADHTLLFIDGIRANDPAAANVPRFELLNGDTISRIELVRGPQSALWGSEAIGGVVAVSGSGEQGVSAAVETGSLGFARVGGALSGRQGDVAIDLSAGFQRATGIDAFDGPADGERDGYRNLSGRARVEWTAENGLGLGGSAFLLTGKSEFDGYDPITFERADTLDNSQNRLGAGRAWIKLSRRNWRLYGWASLLRSTNRNFLDDQLTNRTRGGRASGGLQAELNLDFGSTRHSLVGAAEANRESFRSGEPSKPAADQRENRLQQALVAEWRGDWTSWFRTDVAIRRDTFNRFKDRTTLRASALGNLGGGVQLAASYGEGIAQPNFFELFGFPGFLRGNPNLEPERSRGWEVGARLTKGRLHGAVTLYRQTLTDEIVFSEDFTTSENANGRSRRRGAELELGWSPSETLRLNATYAYLDAEEQKRADNDPSRELRRPKHSGSVAAHGRLGRITYGASIAYVGRHLDRRDSFPFDLVQLDSYWLASGRLGWRLNERFELFGRMANAFDDEYQDLVGYRTEGRSAYAGIRVAIDR